MFKIILTFVLSMPLTLCAYSQSLSSGEKVGPMDSVEYSVVAAVVKADHLPKHVRWFMLSNQTTTFECDPAANTGLSVVGCSGMRAPGQTPQDVYNMLAGTFDALTPEIFLDLMSKAETSTLVDKTLPLKVRQVIWGPTSASNVPKDLGSPDFAIYNSRVGFNSTKTLALVYVAATNWTDSSKTYGEYVMLSRQKDGWGILGRYKMWSME
ncbi:MAG: hypothetical protein ACLP05_02795 [Candidatus Kryptoniota bacterium]